MQGLQPVLMGASLNVQLNIFYPIDLKIIVFLWYGIFNLVYCYYCRFNLESK